MKKSDITTHIMAGVMTVIMAPIIFNRLNEILDYIPESRKSVDFNFYDEDDDE